MRSLFKKFCFSLSTLLAFVGLTYYVVWVFVPACQIHVQYGPFTAHTAQEGYNTGEPLELIDYDAFVPFVSFTYEQSYTELRSELTYYDEPDGNPVLTRAPGKYYIDGSSAYMYGYGSSSWPTYQKEWRYVRPYSTGDNLYARGSYPGNSEFLYVKTSDIVMERYHNVKISYHSKTLIGAAVKQYISRRSTIKTTLAYEIAYIKHLPYSCDKLLYQTGMYYNKYVFGYWDNASTLYLTGIILFFFLGFVTPSTKKT